MNKYFSTIFAVTVLLLASFPPAAPAEDRLDTIAKEIESIKAENKDLKERLKTLEVKDEEDRYNDASKLVNISGYADVEYDLTNLPGVNDHFRPRHMSLFFEKNIQREWNLFTETEYEDAPVIDGTSGAAKAEGKFVVEQMFIKHRSGPEFDISMGRFLTPAGIWLIYHYPPYIPTQDRPLHIRQIFPQYSDGLMIRGSFNLFSSMVDTHVYVSNGSGNSGSADGNSDKAYGLRLNAANTIENGKVEVGGSAMHERDNNDITKTALGAHLKLSYFNFGLQTEYATRQNDPPGAANYYDTGLYTQCTLDIKKWTVAARWDWYNNNSLIPRNDQYVYTGALNYHFAHNVIGKAEYNWHEFNNPATPNYYLAIFSIVVAIGDL